MIKLSIIGNLGADAEVKNHNGKEFVSFRVAHTDRFTQDGQTKETTTWVSCILNGNGGNLLPYLKKGTKVFCHGDFSIRLYRYNGEINAAGFHQEDPGSLTYSAGDSTGFKTG